VHRDILPRDGVIDVVERLREEHAPDWHLEVGVRFENPDSAWDAPRERSRSREDRLAGSHLQDPWVAEGKPVATENPSARKALSHSVLRA